MADSNISYPHTAPAASCKCRGGGKARHTTARLPKFYRKYLHELCLINGTGFGFMLLITSVFLGNSRTKQFHKGLKRHLKLCFVIREKRREREREGGRKYMTKKT